MEPLVDLGSEPGFSRHTVWYEPCIDPDDPESTPLPEFDPENPWWTRHRDMIAKAAEHGRGKALTTIPDLVENLDIFSAMRDPQAALLDLYDRPEWVKAWIRRIDSLYFEYFDRLYDLYHQIREGGKSLLLLCVSPEGAARIVRELGGGDGLYLVLDRELESEAAGEDFLKAACEWA